MDKLETTPWSIRRATARDHDAVKEFQARARRPSRSDSVITEYFVAVSETKIVGCAAVRKRGQVGYLYGLVVDERWRRRGIGHALTQKRLDWLHDRNVTLGFVMAMFWNIRFFKKHGFVLTPKRNHQELENLHRDFTDRWSARSALLVSHLSSSSPASRGRQE
jgi:N-acetylglutamate synthase-like GNAT family acetyltransferase